MRDQDFELLIRLDQKLDDISEDLQSIRTIEDRVSALERLAAFGKGALMVITGVITLMAGWLKVHL